MNCPLCKNKNVINETIFTFFCNNCFIKFSILEPGIGSSIKGLNYLRKKNYINILKYLKKFNKKKILDVGCSQGLFVLLARKHSFKCYGVEPYKSKFLSKIKNFIYQDLFPFKKKLILNKKFDIIIFNDTFEHIDPLLLDKGINQLKKMLTTCGLIFINSPSYDGLLYKTALLLKKLFLINHFYDRLWQKNMASPHLIYFNSKSLDIIFKKNGFVNSGNLKIMAMTTYGLLQRIRSSLKSKILSRLLYIFLFIFLKFSSSTSDIILNVYTLKRNKI